VVCEWQLESGGRVLLRIWFVCLFICAKLKELDFPRVDIYRYIRLGKLVLILLMQLKRVDEQMLLKDSALRHDQCAGSVQIHSS
jgi:hypothetical protein